MENLPRYIVQTASACMPSSCWGRYGRVALLLVDPGVKSVKMISEHARGVRKVVQTWERLNIGITDRCAFNRAIDEAEDMAWRLNAELRGEVEPESEGE